jgi:raffinose/stachyose/melibiose transport system substrate-binding protein
MKKVVLLMGLAWLLMTVTGISAGGRNDSSTVTMEMMTTWTGAKKDALSSILNRFVEQTDIKVELVSPGSEYETVMKTRMSSGNLPDLWETHGWSVVRYSEYLLPLNDQAWFNRIDNAIIPIISDASGKIYVVPLTMGINTIAYSKDAFARAGVMATHIRSWEDFAAACEKLKAAGITPIFVGNKDGGIAQLGEGIPPTYLTNSDVSDNQAKSLKNGTFDFERYWTPIADLINTWYQSNYFNVDILTANNESGTKELGAGRCGMMFGGSNNITQALVFNPNAQLGILAVPSVLPSGKSSLSMGEGNCYGIWKDSKQIAEAKRLLDFLAQPEIVSELATIAGDLPAFKDVNNPDDYIAGVFRETQRTFANDLLYVSLFDREYLPSGMWDDLTVSFTEIIINQESGVYSSVQYLKNAYRQKYR